MQADVRQGETVQIDFKLTDFPLLTGWTCTVQVRKDNADETLEIERNAALNSDSSAFRFDMETDSLEVDSGYSVAAELENSALQIKKELVLWLYVCPQYNYSN